MIPQIAISDFNLSKLMIWKWLKQTISGNILLTAEAGRRSIFDNTNTSYNHLEIVKGNEEKYRFFFSNNPMPMWVFDLETYKILDVNEAAIASYGYSRDEFLNMTVMDMRPPEEIKNFTRYSQEHPQGLVNAGIWLHKKKDGSVIDVEVNSHDIIYDNKPCRLVLANDVTEKLKAGRQIIESEKKYRTLFENNLAGIFQTNLAGKIINCNTVFANMLGYNSHCELDEKNADVLYYNTGDRGKYISTLNKEGHLINHELILKHAQGRPVFVMANISLFTDSTTGEKIIEGVMLDISDRKLAEEKLAESELRFRALVENCHEAITVIDENFITRYRSPSLCKMLGWDDDEKLHKHLSETVHTDDMKSIVLLKEKLLKYPGKPFPITFRSKHISGNYVWMEGVATNMLHDKNVNGIIANFRDISERKKAEELIRSSEERYRQIVETAQEGIWVVDEDNRTSFVNNKMCEIFEYTQDEMMGKDVYFFMDSEGKEVAAKGMQNKKEGYSGQKDFKYISKSGKEIWTNISTNPLFNVDGTYKGALAMVTDITEKVRLQQQLMNEQINQQKEVIKAAVNAQEKERRDIGEDLHDNVNQLLAASKLYLNHSLNGIEDGVEDYKPFVLKSQEYISSAIEEIRKLTKALVGPAREETMGLVVSVIELISDISMVKDIKIGFKHSLYSEEYSDAGLKVVIYRIIQEQLNNILKHAHASEVEIEIKNAEDCLELSIKDNGVGFDTGTKKKGIGLKNIQSRAQIYDGNVEIISSPGNGCKMNIIFQNACK
ncbi:MAG: domain S-box protein [Chitinophagaceae bacterium]|nr:domain S-box protein [Chitinophagaceae bacterium]